MQCLLNRIYARFLLFTDWEELEVRIEMREIGYTWRTHSPEFPNVNEPPLLLEVAPLPNWGGSSCCKSVAFSSEGEILVSLRLLHPTPQPLQTCNQGMLSCKLWCQIWGEAFIQICEFLSAESWGIHVGTDFEVARLRKQKTEFQMRPYLLIWVYLPEVLDSVG